MIFISKNNKHCNPQNTYQHVKAKQLYGDGSDTNPQLSWGDRSVQPTCVSVKVFSTCRNKIHAVSKGSDSILKFQINPLQFNVNKSKRSKVNTKISHTFHLKMNVCFLFLEKAEIVWFPFLDTVIAS